MNHWISVWMSIESTSGIVSACPVELVDSGRCSWHDYNLHPFAAYVPGYHVDILQRHAWTVQRQERSVVDERDPVRVLWCSGLVVEARRIHPRYRSRIRYHLSQTTRYRCMPYRWMLDESTVGSRPGS